MNTFLNSAAAPVSDACALRDWEWTKSLTVRCMVMALFLLGLRIPTAQAQVSASIRGVVTDAASAPVAQAAVNVKNLETNVVRTASTDEAGRYLVLALPVGTYEVRILKSGFQDAVQSGISLVIGQEASINLRLQVSAVKSEVKVTGDAAIVSVTTRDISGLVGEQAVKDLP